jgi:indolepyruvate ferredoxin oxidoreductase alpha subunit
MTNAGKLLLNGNEALARGALDAGILFGSGYPGTPSTEILETFDALGGHAEWAPNEKVALEVGLGAAFGNGRALVTMKHVGLNVAADPLFTASHTGVTGALVVVVADDPGMASSQNEQDSRRYAVASGTPMLEPSDSQEAYDFVFAAVRLSEQYGTPILLRMTTRVSHSKSVVVPRAPQSAPAPPHFERNVQARVMIPAHARPAHRRLRARLAAMAADSATGALNVVWEGGAELGIVSCGVAALHAREAAPGARLLKIGFTYPLPLERIRAFAAGVRRCVVIEEGDPVMAEACLAAGIAVEGKPEMYRFGELNVARVRRILAGDTTPETAPPRGKPPQLCLGCPHRTVFETLRDMGCIVAGDIGCYTLGVLPPFEAMDTCVCMGASIGVGLGLRQVLPEAEARRVVSVIGDSTFMHSGITGIVEMAYNRPPTGHVVLILDNSTTAMTGLQEHPGTGRLLNHATGPRVRIEDLCAACGVDRVEILDAQKETARFKGLLADCLAGDGLSVIIARKPCLLAARRLRREEPAAEAGKPVCAAHCENPCAQQGA